MNINKATQPTLLGLQWRKQFKSPHFGYISNSSFYNAHDHIKSLQFQHYYHITYALWIQLYLLC